MQVEEPLNGHHPPQRLRAEVMGGVAGPCLGRPRDPAALWTLLEDSWQVRAGQQATQRSTDGLGPAPGSVGGKDPERKKAQAPPSGGQQSPHARSSDNHVPKIQSQLRLPRKTTTNWAT